MASEPKILTLAEVDAIGPAASVEFRDIPDHPGYRVGNDGSVWSRWIQKVVGGRVGSRSYIGVAWRRMRTPPGNHGYLTVCLRGRVLTVHRLVLLAFVGECPAGMECRHIDGDRLNSNLSNLAWGTHAENDADKRRHGTMVVLRGEQHGNARLSDAKIADIRSLGGRMSHREIARIHGVSYGYVGHLLKGHRRPAAMAAKGDG